MYNWAVLTINQEPGVSNELIQTTTNNPCHLTLYWTLNIPLRHKDTRTFRGITMPWGAYFCFNAWTAIPQQEAGDTLTHTFNVTDWPHCETRWFCFAGTVTDIESPSISAIYEKHHRALLTYTIHSFKDTWLNYYSYNVNFGHDPAMRCLGHPPPPVGWGIPLMDFNLDTLPPFLPPETAQLRLAFFASTALGNRHWAYRLLNPSWQEYQATYNQLADGFPWAAGAFSPADYTTTSPPGAAATVMDGAFPWSITFNVLPLLQHAIATGLPLSLAIIQPAPQIGVVFYDTREAVAQADRPRLTVTYLQPKD